MKRVILITTIALASLSGCQSGYEDWLMKHPEQEELSKRPIKPVPQEIPITRPDLPPERDEWREVTEGVYNFSWKLFRQYYQQKQDNVLMAPYTMLSTLNRKVRNKGELAQTQFIKSMNIEEDLIDRVNVYFHSMEDYDNHPELLNELALFKMNHNFTEEHDGSIMHQLSVKGLWRLGFEEKETHRAVFHRADGTEKEVDMMFRDAFAYLYAIKEYSVIRINLKSTNFQMFFILPNEGYSIDNVMTSFYPSSLREQSHIRLRLWMPKFNIHDSELLNASVIDEVSSNHADLDNLVDEQQGKNLVQQECFIAIDEKGLNDGSELERYNLGYEWGYASPYKNVRLDSPFIFGVTYCLDHLLFLGYYGY